MKLDLSTNCEVIISCNPEGSDWDQVCRVAELMVDSEFFDLVHAASDEGVYQHLCCTRFNFQAKELRELYNEIKKRCLDEN